MALRDELIKIGMELRRNGTVKTVRIHVAIISVEIRVLYAHAKMGKLWQILTVVTCLMVEEAFQSQVNWFRMLSWLLADS